MKDARAYQIVEDDRKQAHISVRAVAMTAVNFIYPLLGLGFGGCKLTSLLVAVYPFDHTLSARDWIASLPVDPSPGRGIALEAIGDDLLATDHSPLIPVLDHGAIGSIFPS